MGLVLRVVVYSSVRDRHLGSHTGLGDHLSCVTIVSDWRRFSVTAARQGAGTLILRGDESDRSAIRFGSAGVRCAVC